LKTGADRTPIRAGPVLARKKIVNPELRLTAPQPSSFTMFFEAPNRRDRL
jgi:hypothetical protein